MLKKMTKNHDVFKKKLQLKKKQRSTRFNAKTSNAKKKRQVQKNVQSPTTFPTSLTKKP